MPPEPDLRVEIVDNGADQTMKVIGDQVLNINGAADGEFVVVGPGETLDTRTLVDGDIPAAIARTAAVTAAFADAVAPIWVPAGAMLPVTGSPNNGTGANSTSPTWNLDADAIEAVAATVLLPSGWSTYDVELWWGASGAGAGNVIWRASNLSATAGETAGTASNGGDVAAATGGQYIVVRTALRSGVACTPGEMAMVKVQRRASDVLDTLAGDAYVFGVLLTKAS